ncbi:hypothetical protein [Bacillus sp. SH5-2]|uniref:hypothetical protein n=1 Tax=Bacillus sp. SH5-2 TaxID=2217834 RepID=UPI0011ED15D5|nr:hypothetical protein [Bacillus sp. SH5-2]KAA0764296.1 hypothetical protein DN410_11820 [Bacillus sp. SH5-2]
MKKYIPFSIITTVVLLASGCSQFNSENDATVNKNQIKTAEVANNSQPNDFPVINMGGKMVKYYDDTATLVNDSSSAIEGNIVKNKYTIYNEVYFTISTVVVTDVLESNDNIKVGDKITVLQTGGVFEYKSDPKNKKTFDTGQSMKDGQQFEVVFENAPVIKENKKVILFLEKYKGPISCQYVTSGDFQGRFPVDENTDTVSPQNKDFKEKFIKTNDLKEKIKKLKKEKQ